MIALVDGNNFYVSCERVFDLSLRGRPVAVLSNNDGCVISRSQECKDLGVAMGTPFFQLRPKLQALGLTVRSSNYALYGDLSRRVVMTLRTFSPDVEQYSIDEAFVHFAGRPPRGGWEKLGGEMRARVWQWVGIPCGVGLAPTKTLAKIANHIGKKLPGGVFVMPDDRREVLTATPVGEVWGVGRQQKRKLEMLGLDTAWKLAQADERDVQKRFSVVLARTVLELRGEAAVPPEDPGRDAQSVSCSRSFGRAVATADDLAEAVCHYAAIAAEKLRRGRQLAAGANVFCEMCVERPAPGRYGEAVGATVLFRQPTATPAAIMRDLRPRLAALFVPGRRYRRAGVVFFGLEKEGGEGLFPAAPDAQETRGAKVAAAMDAINRRFGRDAVFNAAEGVARPWAMRREFLSPRYTTDWGEVLKVK